MAVGWVLSYWPHRREQGILEGSLDGGGEVTVVLAEENLTGRVGRTALDASLAAASGLCSQRLFKIA